MKFAMGAACSFMFLKEEKKTNDGLIVRVWMVSRIHSTMVRVKIIL